MKCRICGRVCSTTVHLDCMEQRRIEAENVESKRDLPERISLDNAELCKDLRTLLNHMSDNKD